MLFVAASSTIDRGTDFQLGIRQDIESAFAENKPPAELSGNPPFTWRLGADTHTVQHVTILGVDNMLALMIDRKDDAWTGKNDAVAEANNRRFIDGLIKAHPEFKETFGVVVARAVAPSHTQTWGTVYDLAKGYASDKKAPASP
jgi:hypothetical protein